MTKALQTCRLRPASLRADAVDATVELSLALRHAAYDGRLPARPGEQRTSDRVGKHIQRRAESCRAAWLGLNPAGLSATTASGVDDVWVKRQYRRGGTATRLIDATCSGLAQRDFRAAQTGSENFNYAASALFEDPGWRKIGAELVRIAPGIRHEALVYTRPLPLKELP
ncbi:MAG: hypothetical protein P8Y61_14875 [Gammaproteobacteria bacterium]